MARCDNCNRFVALESEIEELFYDPAVSEDGEVTAEVRIVRLSDCCGEEKKQYNMDLAGDITDPEDECESADGHKWEYVGHGEPELIEYMQTKDRHGRPIKNMRYAKMFIGVEIEVSAKCTECGVESVCVLKDETTAGSFEEI